MKTFIAYRSTGENRSSIKPVLTTIKKAFEARGIETYSTFFDEQKIKSLKTRQIVEHTFGILDTIDFLLAVQTSDSKSEGMLMEVGYCLAKHIPIIVATKVSVKKTYLPEIASQSFNWNTLDDLAVSIADLNL